MGLSEYLFYGGIIGMVGSALIGIIALLFSVRRKKALMRKLANEYGEWEIV